MPEVPRSYQRQVGVAPIDGSRLNVNVSPDAFGAAVGRGMENAGDALHRVQMREIERANEIADLDSSNRLSDWEQKKVYDPKNGALAKKGKDAIGSMPEDTLADYDKTVGEIELSLGNGHQKQVFRQRAAERRAQINGKIQSHVSREIEQYDVEQTNGRVTNLYNDSIANPQNAAANIKEAQDAIRAHAQRNGMPSTWSDLKTAETASNTHLGVLTSLASANDYGAAKAYYDDNKDGFAGNDRIQASRLMETVSARSESQTINDAVMLKIQSGDIKTEEQAVAEAIKMAGDNPKLRDEATRDASNSFNLHQRSIIDLQKRYMGMADEQFTESNSVNDIDPGVWSKLSHEQQKSFRLAERQFLSGVNVPDGSDAYYKMRVALMNPQLRDQATGIDLREMRPFMSPGDYKQLIDLQSDVMKDIAGDRKTEGVNRESTRAGIRERVATDTLKSIGMDPEEGRASANNGWTKNPAAIEFRRQLDNLVQAEEADPARKGEPLGFEDVQKIARRLAADIQIDKPGKFWGVNTTHTPAFQMPNASKQAYRIESVPEDYIKKAKAAAGGVKLDDEDLIDGYNRWLNLPEAKPESNWDTAHIWYTGG